MKRSQMLDEIMCCLLAYSATYPQYPLSQLKLAAEEILKKQEELGMQPPLVSENTVETFAIIADPFGWTEKKVENSSLFQSGKTKMKRSEIVQLISEAITLIRYEDVVNSVSQVGTNHADEYASLLLHSMEKAGMLPPFVGEKYKKPGKIFVSVLTEEGIHSGTSEWEKEDET